MSDNPAEFGRQSNTEGAEAENAPEKLLEVIQSLASELYPHKRGLSLTLDSSLDRDAGIDSLGRVELLLRVERAFDVTLPEQAFSSAETPRDLLRVVAASGPARAAAPTEVRPLTLGEGQAAPDTADTLAEVLYWHARTHADRPHVFLLGEEDREERVTYGELLARAQAVASGLREAGLEPGRAVAVMLPTSSAFFYSFFGILLAGGVPVPIYPPARPSQIEDHLRRQTRILSSASILSRSSRW